MRYRIQNKRSAKGAWRDLSSTHPTEDLDAAIARVRRYDPDGLFLPDYRIVDENNEVVASFKTHAHVQ